MPSGIKNYLASFASYMWLGTALFSIRAEDKTLISKCTLFLSEIAIPGVLYVFLFFAVYDFESFVIPQRILHIICAICILTAAIARLLIFLFLRKAASLKIKFDEASDVILPARFAARVLGYIQVLLFLSILAPGIALFREIIGIKQTGLLEGSYRQISFMVSVAALLPASIFFFNLWFFFGLRTRVSD